MQEVILAAINWTCIGNIVVMTVPIICLLITIALFTNLILDRFRQRELAEERRQREIDRQHTALQRAYRNIQATTDNEGQIRIIWTNSGPICFDPWSKRKKDHPLTDFFKKDKLLEKAIA